ncbi:peptidylprolyl isomerase [Deinococcus radiomollis]|uniref:peptidylprolyl isomerase n=1 Tax=Deinococcus radiomollis TaxID=468916 RepID=UPI0038923C47
MRPTFLTLALVPLALSMAACGPRTTTQTTKPATAAAPVKAAPVQTAPAQTAPVQTTPVQMAPATQLAPVANAGYTAVPFLADKPAKSYPAAGQVTDPAKKYRALLTTSKGLVTIDLNSVAAPIAVNSFVFLALNHFYDGLTFHRVVTGFVAQGGDPTGTGAGGPGYQFTTETAPTARFDSAGVLGMARAQSRNSNGSQFFITLAPADFLSGDYTVFGKVVSGQEAVNALTKTENGSATPDTILSVQILAAAK